MKIIKKSIPYLLGLLLIIQFIRPKRNQSDQISINEIDKQYVVSEDVMQVLHRSCYDCHSNNTVYPWYTNVQPVGWWLQQHVNEGKEDLNFSEFGTYEPKKKFHKIKKISDALSKGWMPLNSYLWIHKNAILTADQNSMLTRWADSLGAAIKMKYDLPDEPQENRGRD